MALAFYRTAKPENKQRLKVTLIPLIVTSVLVGITEPFEFLLYLHRPIAVAYLLPAGRFSRCWHGCFTSGSAPLTVSSISSSITSRRESARRAGRCLSPSVCWKPRPCTVGTFCITCSRLLTPGRETAAEDEHSQQANSEHPDKGALVIAGLGGKENVCAVGNCFTRLRVDVRDPALIQQTLLKESGGAAC